MEALKKIGLLHKAFVSQSKALSFFLPLLLLVLALPHCWEALMPTMWHAFSGFFEGPAFAFLLLNCLIVTIIASSKKGGHEEEEEEASKRDEKGNFIAENVLRGGIGQINHNSSYEYHMNAGENFVGIRSCSLNVDYKEQIKKEAINNVNEKKPNKLQGLLLIPNKPLSDLKDKKLMRGSHAIKPALGKKPQKSHDNKGLRRAGNIIDHPACRQAEEAAAAAMAAHPSSEDVWAAIMLTKKSNDRMANYMHAADRTLPTAAARTPPPSSTVTPSPAPAAAAAVPLPPAAARTSPAAASSRTPPAPAPAAARTPPARASVAANPLRAAQAAPNPPGAPPAAAIEKHEDAAGDHEHDSELEELNRRAEEFIARFNHQIRLQHQESWQRKSPCNYHIPYSNHMQLQTPGLLQVG